MALQFGMCEVNPIHKEMLSYIPEIQECFKLTIIQFKERKNLNTLNIKLKRSASTGPRGQHRLDPWHHTLEVPKHHQGGPGTSQHHSALALKCQHNRVGNGQPTPSSCVSSNLALTPMNSSGAT